MEVYINIYVVFLFCFYVQMMHVFYFWNRCDEAAKIVFFGNFFIFNFKK